MRIIISPAKKMKVDTDTLPAKGTPIFLEEASRILAWLKTLSYQEAKKLWGCNDRIAEQNFQRLQKTERKGQGTPAILAYQGIQYQYMAPAVFEEGMLEYVQDHLRILSGFYGMLKPMDGVTPYRLEMQARARIGDARNLYEFWGRRIYEEVARESHVIVNLASREYFKCVEPYLGQEDVCVTCVFGERIGEEEDKKVVQKGTYAKMARGEMVRFLAERKAERPEVLKEFDRLGYRFYEELSSGQEYVFLREE